MPAIDLGTQSNVGRHPHSGVARLVNLRVETAGKEGKVQFPLYAVSGLADFATLTDGGGVRGLLSTGSEVVAVAGRAIYSVDGGGTATLRGGIASDGHVTLARNDRPTSPQVAICCDGLLVILQGGTVTQVADGDVGVPNSVFEIGGFFGTTEASGNFRVSELLDGTDWDGLAVERAGRDLLIGKPRGRDAVLFGSTATHIWTLADTGGAIPFAPRSTLDVGAWAPGGVVTAGGTIYWLSTTQDGAYGGVRALNGDTHTPIGTEYVDRTVARETARATIASATWTEDGRTFAAWSLSDRTHVLDLKTGQWHERSSLIDGRMSRWRVAHTVDLGGRVIAGDYATNKLYRLDQGYHDEAGTELVTILQPPPLTAYPGRIEVDTLHVDVIPGVGLATGASQDVDPQVALRWSSDGETWSTELRRPLGRQGETGRRVQWTRLGTQSRHGRTYQLRASAKVTRGILSAQWDGKVVLA